MIGPGGQICSWLGVGDCIRASPTLNYLRSWETINVVTGTLWWIGPFPFWFSFCILFQLQLLDCLQRQPHVEQAAGVQLASDEGTLVQAKLRKTVLAMISTSGLSNSCELRRSPRSHPWDWGYRSAQMFPRCFSISVGVKLNLFRAFSQFPETHSFV